MIAEPVIDPRPCFGRTPLASGARCMRPEGHEGYCRAGRPAADEHTTPSYDEMRALYLWRCRKQRVPKRRPRKRFELQLVLRRS